MRPEPEMRPEPVEGQALVAAMDRVREVCSTASALRKAEGLRVRLPLRRLTVAVPEPDALRLFTELITDELNVRELVLTDLAAGSGYGVRQVLQVNARAAGPRLGRDVQTAIKAAKAGDWSADAARGGDHRRDRATAGGVRDARPWWPTPIRMTGAPWPCCPAAAS